MRNGVLKLLETEVTHLPKSFAVVSLIYGNSAKALAEGLVLGRSLAGKTTHDCLFMHTADVPQTFLLALGAYWIFREVPEICANLDLVAAEDTRFLRIFTKLHIFNKKTFPYDRVLFLDLDTLVLRGVDKILESWLKLAAVPCQSPRNERGEKLPVNAAEEGEALAAGTTFNGGVLLVSPQLEIFELLLKDCRRESSSWHHQMGVNASRVALFQVGSRLVRSLSEVQLMPSDGERSGAPSRVGEATLGRALFVVVEEAPGFAVRISRLQTYLARLQTDRAAAG